MKRTIIIVLVLIVIGIGFYLGYQKAVSKKTVSKEKVTTYSIDTSIPFVINPNSANTTIQVVEVVNTAQQEINKKVWTALETYYNEHERYPDNLEQLIPTDISSDIILKTKDVEFVYRPTPDRQKWEFSMVFKADPSKKTKVPIIYDSGVHGYETFKLVATEQSTTILIVSPGYMTSPERAKIKGIPELVVEKVAAIETKMEPEPFQNKLEPKIYIKLDSADAEKLAA